MATFTLFGFRTEIHLTFLLIVLLLLGSMSITGVILFTLAIGGSVLLHELGHAWAARRFGAQVLAIRLYALGGVTLWSDARAPVEGWRRFVVAAAGSGVGLIAGLAIFGLVQVGLLGNLAERAITSPIDASRLFSSVEFFDSRGDYLLVFVGTFILASVVWGLINWLPIGGLDGSKMLSVVLVRFLGPSGDLHARIIGLIVAVAVGIWFYQRGFVIAPIVFIAFSLFDLAAYQRRPPPRRVDVEEPPAHIDGGDSEGEETE